MAAGTRDVHHSAARPETGQGRHSARRRLLGGTAIVLLAALAAYLLARREELADIRRLSAAVLLVTLGLQFLAQLLWNTAMLLPLRVYMKLGFWELFAIRTGGFLAGAAIPVAGNLGVRLAYLRRRGLAYPDFTWATIVSNALSLSAAAVLACLAAGAIWAMTGTLSAPAAGLTAAVLTLGVGAMGAIRWLPRVSGHSRLEGWTLLSGMRRGRVSARTANGILAASFGRHAFSFLAFALLYNSLSTGPGHFLTGGLVYAITSPIRIVAITPANVGVIEWAVAGVGKLLAFEVTTGLLVALVFRGTSIVAQVLGVAVAGAWIGIRGEG
ncbi:MAG: flippase-like domain-containing protein [Acidobacteria bacterium]|nr:flippase-like domain-containing protein [Acidobacteriota bacterium]